jgi:hypothetical protein
LAQPLRVLVLQVLLAGVVREDGSWYASGTLRTVSSVSLSLVLSLWVFILRGLLARVDMRRRLMVRADIGISQYHMAFF